MRIRAARTLWSTGLLRQPGGFEGFGAIREPLPAEHLAVAEAEHHPVAPRHAGAAALASHVSELVDHDLVPPGIDELAPLVRALLPGLLRPDEELPDGFCTADRHVLGPLP